MEARSAGRVVRAARAALVGILLARAALPAPANPRREAGTHLLAARKLLQGGSPAAALAELEAARALAPSAEIAEESANAERAMGHVLAARSGYDALLATYGASLKPKDRARVEAARGTADQQLARFLVETDAGATILVDGKGVGTAPLPAPIELDPGAHTLGVRKPGFVEEQRSLTLGPGTTRIQLTLRAVVTTGRLTVQAVAPGEGRVLIDDRDMGDAPWSGELPPGEHTVAIVGRNAASPVQRLTVRSGEGSTVTLPLAPRAATLAVTAADPKARIFVDEVPRADGAFHGELPAGPHTLRVERPGYVPFSLPLNLEPGESATFVVPALEAVAKDAKDAKKEEPERYDGVYAEFGILGLLGTNATHGLTDCPVTGSCNTGGPFGGGLQVHVGYSFGWWSVEALALGSIDAAFAKVDYRSETTEYDSPFFGAKRSETYTFFRYGGGAGLGLRVTPPFRAVRPTLGVAAALFGRAAEYASTATVELGTDPDTGEAIGPGAQSRTSNSVAFAAPAVVADLGVLFGATPGFKVHLGLLLIAEFDPAARADGYHNTLGTRTSIASGGQTESIPHGVPGMDIVHGAQIFLGPVLGMQFGY